MMRSVGWRPVLVKVVLCVWFIVILDLTIRPLIIQTPNEILFKMDLRGVGRKTMSLDLKERAEYVQEYCNSTTIKPMDYSKKEDVFYLLKSNQAGVKDLFVCLPRRMATKSVFDILNKAYGNICDKDNLNCRSQEPGENTVKIVFTRHPLDRLIIGYRHNKRNQTNPERHAQRHLLFSKRLNIAKKRNRAKYQFEEYLKKNVLLEKSILPISQECDVCHYDYDMVYDLDNGLQDLAKVSKAIGLTVDPRGEVKKPAAETRRKFYSELSITETDRIKELFKHDFNLFGYSPNFFN